MARDRLEISLPLKHLLECQNHTCGRKAPLISLNWFLSAPAIAPAIQSVSLTSIPVFSLRGRTNWIYLYLLVIPVLLPTCGVKGRSFGLNFIALLVFLEQAANKDEKL